MMRPIFIGTLFSTLFLTACNSTPKSSDTEVQNVDSTSIAATSSDLRESDFSIENIPYSEAAIGDYPFFTLPKGLEPLNKPFERKFDICFFPLNGKMTAKEGRLYKINVTAARGEEYSQRYFEKSLEDYLTSIGGVKVFDGEISKEEYEAYHKNDPNKGEDGDIGYAGEHIKVFVIRTKDKGNIYVQFSSNNAGGKLNILQEEALVQTITKVTADDIISDLQGKGKSILYINFDVDKANISADGKEVVAQIAEALKKDNTLKIAIEGHTDNTADAAHNKKLSEQRAQTVVNSLVEQGVDKSRLSAKGFGAERPLVANDSDANRAKNRRVELVKVN